MPLDYILDIIDSHLDLEDNLLLTIKLSIVVLLPHSVVV